MNEVVQTTTSVPQAQKTTQPDTPTMPPEKKPKPWLIIVLVFLLITSLGTTGYFVYQNYQLKQEIKQAQVSTVRTPTLSPVSTPTPIPTPFNNWKTYKNEACGFEINYPSEWQVEKDCVKGLGKEIPVDCLKSPDFKGYLGVPSNNIDQGTAITMGCDREFEEKPVQSMINECLEDKQKFPEEERLCELFKGQYEDFAEIRPNEYYLTSNKTLYTIIIEPSSQAPSSVAKQILSTFKLTQ